MLSIRNSLSLRFFFEIFSCLKLGPKREVSSSVVFRVAIRSADVFELKIPNLRMFRRKATLISIVRLLPY